MVLVDSRGISRVPRYSGTCPTSLRTFHLRGFHPLWPPIPERSISWQIGNSSALRPNRPYNPSQQADWFGLFRVRSPLLAESLTCFLFLQVLRWFTSLRSLPWPMYSARDNPGLAGLGCPIRESTGQSLFAALRRLSQLTTPFIAF
jgi:hypothetical protein